MSRKRDTLFSKTYNAPYGFTNSFQLFDATKNDKSFVQRLRLQTKIPAHHGCVNSICWNESGKYLLSGSDDHHLCITDAYSHSVLLYMPTGHRANIFSARFLPCTGDTKVVSCSGDGIIIYTDIENQETSQQNKFTCHVGTAYEVTAIPNDPNTFLSCGEDGSVRWFDLRTKSHCLAENCKEDVLIKCRTGVTALAINPVMPYLLAVGSAECARIYDRRMLGTSAAGNFTGLGISAVIANLAVADFNVNHRITSLRYSNDGQEILVSYSSDFIYLFDIRQNVNNEPKILESTPQSPKKSIRNKIFPSRPSMKRLRVRGDWSDTGPDARPESEARGEERPRSLHASLMQRMSDVLTNMYHHRERGASARSTSPRQSSHSDDSEVEEGHIRHAHTLSEPVSDGSRDSFLNRADDTHLDADIPAAGTGNREYSEEPTFEQSSVSLSFTTAIEVDPPKFITGKTVTQTDLQNNNQAEGEACNLSLQNLRQHELLQSSSGNRCSDDQTNYSEPLNDHIADDDVQSTSTPGHSTDATQASSSKCNTTNTTSDTIRSSCDTSNSIHNDASDNQNQITPSNRTSSFETVSNYDSSSSNLDNTNELSSATSNIPGILVHSSEEMAASRHEQEPPSAPRMAVMMEVDAWDVESDDESRSTRPLLTTLERCLTDAESFKEEVKEEEMDEEEYLQQIPQPEVKRKYNGHRNARTMIKEATFWGDNFVMSGSDCGHIFIWDRHTTELVKLMEADHHVVNCLQPHPFDPVLASSGIDYDIKIWAPLLEDPQFDEESANEIIKRNKVMLEETKDTITVPASFMIRMLASLNNMTTGNGWRRAARHFRGGRLRNSNNR